MVFKPRRLTTSGWMKLSELPVSIKQFISFPQSKILTTALARESGKVEPTEAKVAPFSCGSAARKFSNVASQCFHCSEEVGLLGSTSSLSGFRNLSTDIYF
ncbi:hypothetical protein T4E_1213 [Trichinella pseudospiralis]|uniref:Uncharacterized protein n=1 Tax=Trichinella pseudospiralis TaxID=6337 RepID=A0A0V0XYC1_TRIPS|nr:hypothetical protein T4E_1213 [Trichinella pseudospiralis]